MKNYSVSQTLAFRSLEKPSKNKLGVVRAMQTLDRQGKPAYLRLIARTMGTEQGSITQCMEDLQADGVIRLDSFTKGDFNKMVQTYKLVEVGQGKLC